MGTNFYLRTDPCKECGNHKTELHIGKKSYGWQFHFRGYQWEGITSFCEWKQYFCNPRKSIYDEYGQKMDIDDFICMVYRSITEMSPFNIHTHSPKTDKEIAYLKDMGYRTYPSTRCMWKDREGYTFSDSEFC